MSAPKRIQMRRVKGWRMPEGAIYVGRPSRWGNPFLVGAPYPDGDPPELQHPATRMDVAEMFEDLCHGLLLLPAPTRDDLEPLRGHDLACWCPLDQPCHADVLLEMANQ
jgi:hypothetical protein